MIQKFFEYKLSSENFSKYYYLVLRFNEKTLKNLSIGKLKGLQGISDNVAILDQYFDIRDILLVMDKKPVEKLNKLETIRYDDVDYLTKDSFKVLKRITQDEHDYPIEHLLYQAFRKHEYKRKKNMGNRLIKLHKLINVNWYKDRDTKHSNAFNMLDSKCYEILDTIIKVKDFNDFMSQVYKSLNKMNFKYDSKIVRDCFEYLILSYSTMFKPEGERLIKSKYFTIPEKSVLLIKKQLYTPYREEKQDVIIDKYFDKLKEKYRIKILPYKQGDGIISRTHKAAIPIIRYIDKIKTFNSK